MSKIERYQGNVQAFASSAQGIERTVFGETTQANDLTSQVTAAFLRGWGIVGPSEHPSLEDFNGAMYALSQFIAYQHQAGVPEWHEAQEYFAGSVCSHGGISYQSLEDSNTGNEPPSAQWTPIVTAKNGSEYFQPSNLTLAALALLSGKKDQLAYFNGENTAALTALTAFAREILAQTDAAGVLSKLGLGAAAKKDVGTAEGQIPDMSSFVSNGAQDVFSSIVIAGNRRIMEGNGSGTFVNGVLSFTLPLAYPNTGFTFIPTDIGSGVVSYATAIVSGSVVTIYGKDAKGNMLNASYGFKYIAMGSAS